MDNMQQNFKIDKDLNKFSQKLNYNESQRMGYAFTVSAITGKIIPAAYRAMRNKELDAQWESQRVALKSLDWFQTPIYQLFVITRAAEED